MLASVAFFSETLIPNADAAFKRQFFRWFHLSTFGDLIGDLGGFISNHGMREEHGISSTELAAC